MGDSVTDYDTMWAQVQIMRALGNQHQLPTEATAPAETTATDSRVSVIIHNRHDERAGLQDIRRGAALILAEKVARRPKKGNDIEASPYRPHVPADWRVLLWTSPHSLELHRLMADKGIRPELQRKVFETMLASNAPESRESYGAGLLRFHQFCDREGISEDARMPADRYLLAAFIADAVGTISGKAIRNWLSGLRLWHIFNDADWHGDEGWLPALKRAGDRQGAAFKRLPRGPVTPKHLRAIRASLDLKTGKGAASWSAATGGFWGCRRMGELLLKSANKFLPLRDTSRSTRVSTPVVNSRRVVGIHLVWTKTTTIQGGECILTEILGADADLCPVAAWYNHVAINHSPPPNTPLFAYREGGTWTPLVKTDFIRASDAVFKREMLDSVFGHSYRIGGSLELLLAGVAPEVVMKIGGWTSLCFLIYWRRLEIVLPSAITRAWDARIREFAKAHGHTANPAFDLE